MANELTEDMARDPRLADISTSDLHRLYFASFGGFDRTKAIRKRLKAAGEEIKLPAAIDKALKTAFIELNVLVRALENDETLPTKVHKPEMMTKTEMKKLLGDGLETGQMAVELLHRLRDSWESLDVVRRDEVLGLIKMTGVDKAEKTPQWPGLLAMLGELETLSHADGTDGNVDASAYEPVVARYESSLPAKRRKSAKKSVFTRPLNPPDDAQIISYSPRSTFRFGQWIRHTKFGVGCIVEAGDHLIVEFDEDQKRLVHQPLPTERLGIDVPTRRRPNIDTEKLALASGVTITKLPPQVLDD